MADVLAEIYGVGINVRAAGVAAAILTLLLFTLLRKAMNRKTAGETQAMLKWVDGIGFGLLPAAAVWKIFEELYTGPGREVIEPLPMVKYLTGNGKFIPCSIETAAALLCFAGLCIWLAVRTDELTGKDDLLFVSLCLWSGIRIVTESFREDPNNVIRYTYCLVILICLAVWTTRQKRQPHSKQRIVGSWLAVILCISMIILTASGTLSVGSAIGDLAVITGCTVLITLLTLLSGSDSRTICG